MPPKPPRFLPTVALAVLWLAVYFLWLAVRSEPVAVTKQPVRRAPATSSTTVSPIFKIKP